MRYPIDELLAVYREMKYPVYPHMSFHHARHGINTERSSLKLYLYELQYEQWKVLRKEFYRLLKIIKRRPKEYILYLQYLMKYGEIPWDLQLILVGIYKDYLRRINSC